MRTILLLLVATVAATFAYAQDSVDLLELAEKVKKGEIDVGKQFSMDHKEGRFHIIHADILGLDCSSCHYGKDYRADFLTLRKFEHLPKRAKGQQTWSSCLGCHQEGGTATPWYHGRAGQ